jgi:hypothetical protein
MNNRSQLITAVFLALACQSPQSTESERLSKRENERTPLIDNFYAIAPRPRLRHLSSFFYVPSKNVVSMHNSTHDGKM